MRFATQVLLITVKTVEIRNEEVSEQEREKNCEYATQDHVIFLMSCAIDNRLGDLTHKRRIVIQQPLSRENFEILQNRKQELPPRRRRL